MNAGDHMPERAGCGADAGAYVLGALTTEESEAFRRHLSTCVICRDEVAALKMVADTLPLTAPQVQAPRRLRKRILPVVRSEAKARTRAAAPGHRIRRARARPAAALAAALALLAIVGAIVLASSGSGGARVVQASVALPAGNATVRVAGGHAELSVRNLPPPPAGKIYEVWLKREGHSPSPTSALFDVTSAGDAAVDIPGDLRSVREVLVTPEPRGGSAVPTHAPVIVARLS